MGMIICKKHGECGIAINIQKEICKNILENKPLKDEDLRVIKVKLYDGNVFLMDMNYIVTKLLRDELHLKEDYEIREEEEDEQLIKPFETRMGIICGQCLNEYKYKNDIAKTLEIYNKHVS